MEKTPGDRPVRVRQVAASSLVAAHTKISEMNTDLAGRFANVAGGGVRGGTVSFHSGISDQHLDLETDRRIVKDLASQITEILEREHPSNWSFAAPPSINEAVLEQLPPRHRSALAENLSLDLVNTDAQDLTRHFDVRGVEVA